MRLLGFYTLGHLILIHFAGAATTCSMTNPCLHQLGENEDYQEPEQLVSSGGPWTVNMTVDMGNLTYGWLQLTRRLYNGNGALGPTFRLKKGDLLTLNLKNNLSPTGNDNGNGHNAQNFPNTTNLHTHGLHISGENPQDSVVIKIDPQDSHQYRYQIHPYHSSGTYWYHAHVHGSTIFQVSGGLAGILIVDDDPDDTPAELRAASCPWNCDNDVQLLFQPLLLFNDDRRGYGTLQKNIKDYDGFRLTHYNVSDGSNLEEWLAANIKYFTTNGQLKPRKKLVSGEMYRFRMVNAGGGHNLELSITEQDGTTPTSSCEVREIAIDGIYLNKPRKSPHGQTMLVAGSKADWLVRCDSPGTYVLSSIAKSENQMGSLSRYEGILLTLEVSAGRSPRVFPRKLPCLPPYLTDQRIYKEHEIKGRFVIELATDRHLNREHWSVPDYYRYAMVLGEPQEWHFVNADFLSHPLHIHVNHFQVISYNNYTGAVGASGSNDNWNLNVQTSQQEQCHFQHANYNPNDVTNDDDPRTPVPVTGLARAEIGEWRDVLLVPALSNITVRFTPSDFTGDVIIHCHILDHEDGGMMMIVKAVNPGESTDANIKSGDAYPGTCQLTDRYPFNNPTTLGGDTDTGWKYDKGGRGGRGGRGPGARPHADKKPKRRGVNRP